MTAQVLPEQMRAVLALMEQFVDRVQHEADETTRVEGYQWLFEYTAAMYEYYVHADPAHPIVMPMVTPFRRYLGDLRFAKHCYVAKLSADYTYRLRCVPGDAVFTSITVHADETGGLAGNRTLGKFNHHELDREPDGSFEIVIGREARGPNRIAIDDTVGSLMTREFFYEPLETRREARWHIEVLSGPPTSQRVDVAAISDGFAALVANLTSALPRHPRPNDAAVFGRAPLNEFEDFFEFSPDNVTTWGNLDAIHTTLAWSLADDQALVVEGGPVVDCSWWGVTLSNRYLASFGRGTPTAIAGNAIATEPGEGWNLALSARRPPGVRNWLSTAGHSSGVLRIRWLAARERPQKPFARVVALRELE